MIVGTVAFFLLVALGVLATRPDDAFGPRGPTTETDVPVGEVLMVGLAGPSREVQVTEARPLVSGDATVRVQVLRCRAPRDGSVGEVRVGPAELAIYFAPDAGTSEIPLELPCGDLLRVPGPLGPFVEDVGDQVVLVVEPLEPGSIEIDGVAVTHVRWLLHRTERTGPRLRITATP